MASPPPQVQARVKEVDMQQKSSEARCIKSDGPVIKTCQPLSRVTRSMMALVAHFLPWNFVKFADYRAMAEYIEVGKQCPQLCVYITNTF